MLDARRISTRARWSVASGAAVFLLAACGGGGKSSVKQFGCVTAAEGRARIATVLRLYRSGALGTPAELRRKVGRPAPFLDPRGNVIPYERLSTQRRIEFGRWIIDLAGADESVRSAENAAARAARAKAQRTC